MPLFSHGVGKFTSEIRLNDAPRADIRGRIGRVMADRIDKTPKPTPMLEQELSQETLDAIKAIVIGGQNTVSPAPSEQLPSEGEQARVSELTNEPEPISLLCSDGAEQGKSQDDVRQSEEGLVAESVAEDERSSNIEMIREAVEFSENLTATETVLAPEEIVTRPPGVALRLKRHLRNKIKMHFLILKMKVRDLLPTKREALQSLTPRRLAIALMLAVLFVEPWFYPTVLVLILFLGSFTLLLMGPDRTRHYADLGWRRFKRRNPEKALEIRARAMDLSEKWQTKVDRLPTRWTRGLHMPQFQTEAEKSAADSAYAHRMARIALEEQPKAYH